MTIFPTYDTPENRVTQTTIAVLRTLGIDMASGIIGAAIGDESLGSVAFLNQIRGSGSVPDAEISASFRWLIETKITPNSIGTVQLNRHRDMLKSDLSYRDARLIYLTPDLERPDAIPEGEDLAWMSFRSLADAATTVAGRPETSERDRFLLTELVGFYQEVGLLNLPHDVLIVTGSSAYDAYRRYGVYLCGPSRTFRAGVERMAFYHAKALFPQVPRILDGAQEPRVITYGDDDMQDLISMLPAYAGLQDLLADDPPRRGRRDRVFALSTTDSHETVTLPIALQRTGKGPWIQGTRYARLDQLMKATTLEEVP